VLQKLEVNRFPAWNCAKVQLKDFEFDLCHLGIDQRWKKRLNLQLYSDFKFSIEQNGSMIDT
jgi:hypothetical protein